MQLKSLFSDLLAANEHRISAIFWSQEGSINKRQMGMVFTACFTLGVLLKNRKTPKMGNPKWATNGFFRENGEGLEIEIYIYIYIYVNQRLDYVVLQNSMFLEMG
jgi:hypothetical protein